MVDKISQWTGPCFVLCPIHKCCISCWFTSAIIFWVVWQADVVSSSARVSVVSSSSSSKVNQCGCLRALGASPACVNDTTVGSTWLMVDFLPLVFAVLQC